eukprot:CAMPEP_0183400342 /NCGR_PEP_ID=MMETSP0370-20130417/12531_1 /TAXON_ID=268820 /ORGANISM="Peridinium aciculiferum, Strain PAER-2" /LENGTH=105 /DNA_ID=CAMNT_0025581629 /DNA_START=664 /DNA_END=981 /DNA_ORIENTATION=+
MPVTSTAAEAAASASDPRLENNDFAQRVCNFAGESPVPSKIMLAERGSKSAQRKPWSSNSRHIDHLSKFRAVALNFSNLWSERSPSNTPQSLCNEAARSKSKVGI